MTKRSFWRYENGVLVMLFLANGFMFFDRLAFNFLVPFMRGEFQLTKAQIGGLNAALGLAWAISGYLLSRAIDKREIKRVALVAAVALFSLCSIGSGLATTFVALLIARVVMGLAEGPVLPVTQSLMAVESSPHRLGLNMGVIQAVAAGVFGQILGPALIIPLAMHFGWRTAFFIAGVPGLLLALLLWFKLREPSIARFAAMRSRLPSHGGESAVDRSAGSVRPIWNRNVILCTAIACLMITAFFSVIVFGPLYLVEQRKFNAGQMGIFMTVLGISSVIGGALIPMFSDRVGRRISVVMALVLLAFAPLVVAFVQSSLAGLCVFILATWLGTGALSILLATIPSESVDGAYGARATAVVVGISEVIGGCLSPLIAGIAADHVGAEAPFVIGSAAAMLAAVIALFLKETAPALVDTSQAKAAGIKPQLG